ncbi:MAG: chloride channel protein [Bacteroidetes bacterium 46-16]|nr:MAG: chloride channel protein [Bacteroidetes bacterium 46-16]
MEKNTYDKWFRIIPRKIYNEKLKMNVLQALPYWVASLITGLIAVYYAKLFAYAESLSLSIVHRYDWAIFIITPVCFVLAWWLVKRFDNKAGGSGIPQVMAAIELASPRYNYLVDKFLGIKTIVIKVLSSILMIFGGGAIGREGPTVQIAGSVFRKVNQLIPKSWPRLSKKNMIMAGAAAGLAAAFNTPLGGIVFAVEELAKTHINYFKTALFTAVIIAGLTAQGMLGPYLYLGYPQISHTSGYIFFYVLVVACLAGFLGSFFSVIILRVIKWRRTLRGKGIELAYVAGCALVIATIAYFAGTGILGSGKEEMSRVLFSENKNVGWALPFFRFIGPIGAFTSGASGGIFAPSLGAGATVGALVAELMRLSADNANILILAGMVAFLTGVTRSPFTSAILVLEMTDRHNIIFHLMMAGMVAGLISVLIDKHSLYDHLKDTYLAESYKEGPEPEEKE